MKLVFLGTRGETLNHNRFHKKNLATFIRNKNKNIFLDFGSDWKKQLPMFMPDYIWLSSSSLHHVGGIEKIDPERSIVFTSNSLLSATPLSPALKRGVSGEFSIDSQKFKILELSSGDSSIENFSAGLIINTDVGKVSYLPDLNKIKWEELKDIDFYIGDGTSISNDENGHLSIESQLASLSNINQNKNKLIAIFTNIGEEGLLLGEKKFLAKVSILGKKFGIDTRIAHDGLVLNFKRTTNAKKEEILSNYLGSKKRFASKILEFIPEETKTLFDPMCGIGAVLVEAARKGIEIIGNDICPSAYFYCKGIFQGEQLNSKDLNRLLKAERVEGWLSKAKKLQRPESNEARRYIDGIVLTAWKFEGKKKNSALAIVSSLLQTFFREYFISQYEPYSDKIIVYHLKKKANEINSLISEIGGKGKIFNRDAFGIKIPKSGAIYFDPPYFPKNVDLPVTYFKRYRTLNSVLLQKDWRMENPTPEEITQYIHRLSENTPLLLTTVAKPSIIDWEDKIKKLKSNCKVIPLAKVSVGAQFQGGRGVDSEKKALRTINELLIISSDKEILRKSFRNKLSERLEKLAIKPYYPEKMRDNQLNDDFRIFAGWNATLKAKATFKYKEKEILNDFLIPCLKEAARDIYLKAFSKIIKKGLPLIEPHAKMIYDEEKVAIVKKKKFDLSSFRILCSTGKDRRGKAYGFIRCKEPKEIDMRQFHGLRSKHRISEPEAIKWWNIRQEIKLLHKEKLNWKCSSCGFEMRATEDEMFERIMTCPKCGAIMKQFSLWQQKQKINSPTFAYLTVYGKMPKNFLRGRTDAPKKMWRGHDVDASLKDKWLEDLNSIPEIEVRSSDAGKSKERVAFVVFRFKDKKNDKRADAIVNELRKAPEIYARTDIGMEERPRICVAGKVIVGKPGWEEWWNSLAGKIKSSVEKTFGMISDLEEKIDLTKSRYSYNKCMRCNNPPEYEVLWAEGMARAWFCKEHLKEWIKEEHDRRNFSDINSIKKIDNGEVGKKWKDNTNGDIKYKIRESLDLPKLSMLDKKKVSSLYYYPIRDFIPFPKPRSIIILPGNQTAIKKVKYLQKIDFKRITAENIKALNNMDLVILHARVHDAWEERGARKNDELMINLHILIIEELARRNMEHRIQDDLDEISVEARGLKIKDKVYLKDWLELYNEGFYLKDPFMAAIGSVAVSGRGEDADIWINLPLGKDCPVCAKLFGDLEFRLRSFLNENLNNRIKFIPHAVPDPEGKFTNYLEIAKLKVEIIPPEKRRFVTMEQKQKIEVGKPFVPLKAQTGYAKYEFFDKEELWNKWMIKYMKDC